jgi:hypothetical protein
MMLRRPNIQIEMIFPFISSKCSYTIKSSKQKRDDPIGDIGPGSYYETTEGCNKLKAIANYLCSEQVPFQIAMIPRYKKPDQHILSGLNEFKFFLIFAYSYFDIF